MTVNRSWLLDRNHGYAVLTVTIFAFIIVVAGASIFALASYETKGAIYRQNSSEAFYLADGAIERARAKFLENRAWRDGWADEAAGRGTYDLAVKDTTFAGATDVVQLVSAGHVKNGDRKVEVFAQVPPTAFGLAILMWEADVNGNLCIEGGIHVNEENPDFGPNDVHLACDDDYTSGFTIVPPYMYTEPEYYPDATYYFVRGVLDGGPHARIYNRDGENITEALDDSLVDITSYNNGQKEFTFDFNDHNTVDHYFNDETGIFQRFVANGDIAVVVNFGEPPVSDPPGDEGIARVIIDGNNSTLIHTTIINTRYVGPAVDSLRVDYRFWKGGVTELKHIKMEPYYGLALLIYDLDKPGSSKVYIGSDTWPALLYVTRDVDRINANFELVGSLICLHKYVSQGGPHIEYNDGFIENLPPWLQEDWPDGVSGTLKVLRWREIAALN